MDERDEEILELRKQIDELERRLEGGSMPLGARAEKNDSEVTAYLQGHHDEIQRYRLIDIKNGNIWHVDENGWWTIIHDGQRVANAAELNIQRNRNSGG